MSSEQQETKTVNSSYIKKASACYRQQNQLEFLTIVFAEWSVQNIHTHEAGKRKKKKKHLITDGTKEMSLLQLNKQLELWARNYYYTWWILDHKELK